MKRFIFLSFLILTQVSFGQSNILLINEGFETNGNPSRYSVTNGLAADCDFGEFSTRLQKSSGCWTSTPSNAGGSWLWGTMDNDNPNPGITTVTFNEVSNIQAYTNFRVKFYLGAPNTSFSGDNYSNDTPFRVQLRDGTSGSYNNVVVFRGTGAGDGPLYENGAAANGAVPAAGARYEYSVTLTNNKATLRFQVEGDVYAEFAIDDIQLIADCALPLPSITTLSSDGSNNICPGQTVDLKTDPYSGDYKWYKNGVEIPNSNAQQITISDEGRYRVEYVGRTCNDTNSVYVGEFIPAPYSTISASGPLTYCDYNPTILTADETSNSYQWFLNGNPISGETNTSIDPTPYGSGDYQILLISSDNCETFSETKSVVVHQTTKPIIIPDGDTRFCEGTTRKLEAANKGATGYRWFKNDALLNGETNATLNVQYPDSGFYQLEVTEPNGCVRKSDSMRLSILPAPAQPSVLASGSTFRCDGDSVKLRSSVSSPAYQWYFEGAAIQNATNRDYFAKEDGDYSVVVFSNKGCTKESSPFNVTVYPLPPKPTLNVSDTTDLCRGEDITLVSSQASGYQWFLNDNPISAANFRGFTASVEGEYVVRIEDNNGCFNFSDPVYVRTNIEQVANIQANGSTTICPDDEVILTSNYEKGNQWYFNGMIVAGTKTQEFAARDSGKYFSVVNINGCVDTTNTIQVDFFGRPNKPHITPGDTAVCDGSNITFTSNNAANYQWYFEGQELTGETNASLTASQSGLYYVETVDGNGCTNRDSVQFTKFFVDPVVITPSDTTICEDASITFTSNYAQGNQWYFNGNIIPGATGVSVTVDQAGEYYVKVSLANCVDSSEIVRLATNFAQPQPQITVNGPTLYCPGDSTELVSSNAVQYQWLRNGNHIQGATTKRLYPKEAGDYQVIAFNQFGCSDTSGTVSIFTYPGPEFTTVTVTDNTCPGFTDGGISATSAGGTAPIEFSVDGITWQSNGAFPNLGGGDYRLRLRDANGCMDSVDVTIEDRPSDLAIVVAAFDALCWNSDDGQIFASGSGGQPPYEYSIDGINYQVEEEFKNVPTGVYVVRVRDNFGCIAESDSARINAPDELIVNAQLENPISCAGETNAFITATATGGTPGYFYSIDGTSFQSSPQFPNLGPGSYNVTLQDQNGCLTVSDPILIEDPDTLRFNFALVAQNVNCFGERTGVLSSAAEGGTPPYEFSVDGANFSNQSVITNLPAGSYNIIVRDNRGCEAVSDTLIVTEGDELTITAQAANQVDCFGYSTGKIIVGGVGGTGPLEYSIDLVNYQPGGVFDNLAARTYDNITVRDSLGCVIFADPVTITQPDPFTIDGILEQPISCDGASDASIRISTTGGAGGNTFSIDGGNSFFADSVFQNLGPGTYNLVVEDMQGCQVAFADPIIVTNPNPISLDTVTLSHLTCNGLGNGVITIFAQGGTPPLQYSVDGGQTFVQNPIRNSLQAGNYSVVIKDSRGCLLQGPSVTLFQPDSLRATAAVTSPVSCNGLSDGQITITSTGGNGGHIYSIDGGQTFQGSKVFNNLPAGVYTIQVNDNLDCQTLVTIQVTEPNPIALTSLQKFDVSCNGANDAKILAQAVGGTGVLNYSIDGGQTFQTNGIFNDIGPDAYTLVIEDQNGCRLAPIQINVTEPDTLASNLVLVQPVNCNGVPTGTIKAITDGGTKPYQFSLNGAPPVSDSIFDQLQAGNYAITITDAKGCVTNTNVLTITAPPALNGSVSVNAQLSCFNSNDGVLVATASGGVGNFSYSLDGITFGPSNVFSNLPADVYTVYVMDDNGCVIETNPVELINPNELVINANLDFQVSCAGGNDAQITAWAFGGSGNKLFSLDGGPLTNVPIFDSLSAGLYIITAVDDRGCAVNDTVFILDPEPLNVVLDDSAWATNGTNGFIRLDVMGGTPPYTYIWSNGSTTQDIFGLANGTYDVVITDANDCKQTYQITLGFGLSVEESAYQFKLYPNPSQGIVFMEWENTGINGEIRVFNGIGEVILSQTKKAGSQRIKIDLSNYPSGIYQVEFSNKGNRKVHPLVIE